MDDAGFNTLTRALAQMPTRRRTLQSLGRLLLGGILGSGSHQVALGKKRHGRHHKRKRRCAPNCAGTCPAGSPPCGAGCCTAPPGFTTSSISCDASGGAPVCACTYQTADVCAPGCASSRPFTTACTAFAPDFLAAWCPEAGCTPPG